MAAQIPEAAWDCETVTSSLGPGDTGDWQRCQASPSVGRMYSERHKGFCTVEMQQKLWPVTQMDTQRNRLGKTGGWKRQEEGRL